MVLFTLSLIPLHITILLYVKCHKRIYYGYGTIIKNKYNNNNYCYYNYKVLGAVLLTVGRSYVGNDVTPSTLLDRACACSYKNLPKYRSYRISNTAP